MRKLWFAPAALMAFSGCMFADTIWTGSTGSLIGVPTTSSFVASQVAYTGNAVNSSNSQVPFWNNPSQDSTGLKDGNVANVGDVIAGLATGTNLVGTTNLTGIPSTTTPNTSTVINGSYYASATPNGDPVSVATPTSVSGRGSEVVVPSLEFSFMSTATALQVAVLFADSGLDTGVAGSGTSFGTYILNSGACGINCNFTPTPFGLVSNNITGTAGTSVADTAYGATTVYGYYATVCYQFSSGTCSESITYTTGAGNFSNNIAAGNSLLAGLDWNHFAYFELANGEMVFGFEDSPYQLGTANAVEGIGDFNDVVFAVTGNPAFTSSTPEPATIAIMGLGLAGLGLIGRRRFAKK